MKDLRRLLALAGMCAILSEAAPQTADAFPPDSVTSVMDYENMLQQLGPTSPLSTTTRHVPPISTRPTQANAGPGSGGATRTTAPATHCATK